MRITRMLAGLACLLCLSLLPAAAYASAPDADAEQYVVYLPEAPASGQDGLKAVPYAERYYTADSIEAVLPLVEEGAVEVLARNETLELFDVPNDPKLDRQWYLNALGMDALWDTDFTGEGVTIAVIDSGVYADHEEFADANITGRNFLNSGEEPEAFADDIGHGTLVAGILAAGRDNGVGGAGLVPRANIMALRCFSSSGNGGSGKLDTILSAIGWAVQNGADVINMSFGGTDEAYRALEPLLQEAADAGVLSLAAVGNSGGTKIYYPAAFDCVTGVGWTDQNAQTASGSQHNESVYVTAPGSSIYGPGIQSSDTYRSDSGTSFSTPIVAALAAYAKQADRAVDCDGFRKRLRICAQDKGAEGWDEYYGYGVVRADAFAAALEAPQPVVYACGEECAASEDWPASYQIGRGADLALPDDAARECYAFAGWFLDEACEGEPLTAIPAGSGGEVVLYAKWELRTEVGEIVLSDGCAVAALSAVEPAVALLSVYDDSGRFLRMESRELAVGERALQTFSVPDGAGTVKLLLLSPDYAPLCAARSACQE